VGQKGNGGGGKPWFGYFKLKGKKKKKGEDRQSAPLTRAKKTSFFFLFSGFPRRKKGIEVLGVEFNYPP